MIEVRVLASDEAAVLMNVADDVFDNPVDPSLAREFLADPRHHIAVALDGGTVVGFASGIDYIHPDRAAELFINEVGVAASHQRRGIGKAVTRALLDVGQARGCTGAWVITDEANVAARALYVSMGASVGADDDQTNNRPLGYSFSF